MKKITVLLSIVVVLTSCKKETGCTDPTARNYNSSAVFDDGTCFGSAFSKSSIGVETSESSQEDGAESNVSIEDRIIGTWNAERSTKIFGADFIEIGTMTFYNDGSGVELFDEFVVPDGFEDEEGEEGDDEVFEESPFTWSISADNKLIISDVFGEYIYSNDINLGNQLEFSYTEESEDETESEDGTDSGLGDLFGDLADDLFEDLMSGKITLKLNK